MAPLFSKADLNKFWHKVQNEVTLICAKFGKDLFNISKVIGRKTRWPRFLAYPVYLFWRRVGVAHSVTAWVPDTGQYLRGRFTGSTPARNWRKEFLDQSFSQSIPCNSLKPTMMNSVSYSVEAQWISDVYIVRIYLSLGIFTAIFV